MSNVSVDEFKRLIKNSSHKETFENKIIEYEKKGQERPDAWMSAKKFVESLMDGTGELEDVGEAYLNENFGASKDIRADYMWVNDNRHGAPDWSTCPSNGARNIYHDIKTNAQHLARFIETLSKVLPTGTELKELERRQDDGRKLTKLNKKIAEAKLKAMGKAIDGLGLDKGDDE